LSVVAMVEFLVVRAETQRPNDENQSQT
jgi:hypothetical protein